MITMDMNGYGYDIQTFACKYNDGILVQTNITIMDQSCAQRDEVLQQLPIPFTTSGDKGNLSYTKTPEGVFSVLTQQVASLPNESGPIDIIPIGTSSLSTFFTELNDFSMMDSDDVPEPSEAHTKSIENSYENSYSESRIVDESFLEFTQSLQTATSRLRKKITRFIHFPKDMKT
jgi:hypothetical protein